jgi:hypothetical protein
MRACLSGIPSNSASAHRGPKLSSCPAVEAEAGALCYPLFGLTNRGIFWRGGNFWLWFSVVLAVLVIAYAFFDLR